jgi:hypothetical protein
MNPPLSNTTISLLTLITTTITTGEPQERHLRVHGQLRTRSGLR